MSNQPSAGSSSGSSFPPPAPPLPPPRASNRMTNALSRILTWGNTSRFPEIQAGDHSTSNATHGTIPSSSQNAAHKTELEMTSLATSSDGKYAVLAGEKIFKTIKIEGTTITEKDDLRAAITSQASTHSDASINSLQQLDIKDVQWSHSELSSTVIAASANGRITLYDVNRIGAGLEVGRIQGHHRQIHKISVNPHKGNWLLSASQDGTIKLFDLRVHSTGQGTSTFNATSMYKCNAEAVRDVKWSPKDGMEFACATDAGVVQKWDMRQTMSPVLKLNAHSRACRSISWHPDGENLISGGLDQCCYVWDVSKTAEKRQKPKHTIQTPAPVSIVSWRPPKWTSTFEKWRAAQVAVVYDDTNPAEMQESTVQIWDIARPGMPFKEVFDFETSPTGLIWQGSDLLWTVGKYGTFTQTDIAFAAKTIDNRSLACMAISSTGELLLAVDKRIRPARQRPVPPTSASGPGARPASGSNTDSQASNMSGALNTGTFRADAEDDLVGNFLNIRPRRRRRRRAEADQQSSAENSSQAPPTLAESLEITGPFVNKQLLGIGHVPGTADIRVWDFLSKVYLGSIYEESKDAQNPGPDMPPMNVRFEEIMEQWATAAEMLNWYRTAQSWRVISHSLGLTLERRAAYHRDQRVARHQELQEQQEKEKKLAAKHEKEVKRQEDERKNTANKSSLSEDIESTSNVATPLVRPAQGTTEADTLTLSPSGPLPASNLRTSSEPSTEGYDFYDTSSIVPAIDITTPQRKLPLRLDYPQHAESSTALRRHDSNESFQMFSTSEESRPDNLASSSDFESSYDAKGKQIEAPEPPMVVVQEASLPNVDNKLPDVDNKLPDPGNAATSDVEPDSASTVDPSQIIHSDYFPQPGDPLFIVAPLSPEVSISRFLEYESKKGALTPAAIVLFLKPLLQPDTIDENQSRQILLHYYQRLNTMSLFASAALLRKLCVPDYPAVYEQGRWGKELGFKCGNCGGAMATSTEQCKSCDRVGDFCALCQCADVPDTIDGATASEGFDPTIPGSGLWTWCQGCQHGGHAACMEGWHSENGDLHSGGECPVEGCGHACIPGKHQEELTQEAEAR